MSTGRREVVDEKSVLSEVSKLIHAAKANKKVVVNARRHARKAKAKKGSDPASVTPRASEMRKAGGSVWVTLKCQFATENRRDRDTARAEKGLAVKEFTLPDTNRRYRMRCAKWEAAAAEDAAAAGAEQEEEVAEEEQDDTVQDAPAEEVAAEEAAPTRVDQLLSTYGTGASKCIVRTKSSVARKIKRKAVAAPAAACSADASVRGKAESAERRRTRQRRVKQQKATSVLASKQQGNNFATQLIALLRKDVYPQLQKSAAAPATAGASPAHKDPHAADDSATAAKGSGKPSQPAQQPAKKGQQQQQQQQQQQASGKGGKGSGKSGGGKKRK